MRYPFFIQAIADAQAQLKTAPIVHTPRWQGVDISKAPEMATHEVLNHSFTVTNTDHDLATLALDIGPNLPWADDHFLERVCGQPINPGI